MATDVEELWTGMSRLGTLLGMGSSLKDLFAPGNLSAADIKAAVREEVEQVFFKEEAEDKLNHAAAVLQDSQDFIGSDYKDNFDQNVSRSDMWSLFDGSNATPSLSNLNVTATDLEGWIDDAAGRDGSDKIAATGATIYLGIYLQICLFRRLRSTCAPDPGKAAAELNIMHDSARKAVKKMTPHVVNLLNHRLNCLSYHAGPEHESARHEWIGDYMTDSWFDGGGQNSVFSWKRNGSSSNDNAVALHAVMHNTSRLLWSGAQADADALWNSLAGPTLQPPPNYPDYTNDFRGLTFTAVWDFGKWAGKIRGLLGQLNTIASGVPGNAQDDWARCSRCASLYFPSGPSVCPAGGAHGYATSTNYLLRCDSPTPPAGAQPDWRWCDKCGALHFAPGQPSACPAGGRHEATGSASYELFGGSPPAADAVGIETVEQGWMYCNKCGVLHQTSPGLGYACAGGGTHSSDGSWNYWLTVLGNAPPMG